MKLRVLMYHMVLETTHPLQRRYAVSPSEFRKQMKLLKLLGYSPVSLDQVFMTIPIDNKMPDRPIAITFDDGYMNTYENALPVLLHYKYPAAIFMVAGLAGGSNKWDIMNGRPEEPLMGW